MKLKLCVLTILSFVFSSQVMAQTVTGYVTDMENTPLINANVININSGDHTHTDFSGNFTVSASVGDSIIVSYLGYKQHVVTISSNKILDIGLETDAYNLNEVIISPELDAMHLFSDVVLHANPVNSSQEILQQVPGLFIGQHAGGGKAEQIFMRGFDIDHGTDVNIKVDGMPVNMVSHAHGQGYADLHFLIPETVEHIDFGKGSYYANKGNFTTAGYVGFNTKDRLAKNVISLETGMFNTQRIMGMYNLVSQQNISAYLASEYILTDGAFDSPQNFNRINIMGKIVGNTAAGDKIEILSSFFKSEWDASGQIPQRAVDDGSIGRFGAIDDTEGGYTSRKNVSIRYDKNLNKDSYLNAQVYYCNYMFDLYSNFTFFLNDPVNGDQIKQKEERGIFGMNTSYNRKYKVGVLKGSYQLGFDLQNDKVTNSELTHTLNRNTNLNAISIGDINETNFGTYANVNFEFGRFVLNPALRADVFKFVYNNKLKETYSNETVAKTIISPKLNLLYNYSNNVQFYLKSGKGFHSNDTRVVIEKTGEEILPSVYGTDLGFIWKPVPSVILNTAAWYLFMEQEFIYVGDEGVVEPGGESVRKGIDVSVRYQPFKWLYTNIDANYAVPRAVNDAEGENYLPLAPPFTLVAGIHVMQQQGFYASLNAKHMADRPANENNSIVAHGYTVLDAGLGYLFNNFDIGLHVQNLLNTEWNETQFATESRLYNEPNPVEEIHFIPGTPFYIKGSIAYKF